MAGKKQTGGAEPKVKKVKKPGPRTLYRNPVPTGRPRTTIADLPADWKEIMLAVANDGGSIIETMCKLGISTHAWDTLLTDSEIFRSAAHDCRLLSQVWWETVGRKLATGSPGSANAWSFNMKNRFGWRDKTEITGDPNAPMQHEVKKRVFTREELAAELAARGLPTKLLKD